MNAEERAFYLGKAHRARGYRKVAAFDSDMMSLLQQINDEAPTGVRVRNGGMPRWQPGTEDGTVPRTYTSTGDSLDFRGYSSIG